MQGWCRSFEDLCGVIEILDDFDVCYRMKYSGVRSLHLMIPFEAFPKQFNGKSVLSQRTEIRNKIQSYFHRHGGMERAHGGGVMRLAYSLNEDNGLVSLPFLSSQLSDFRPWEANIYHVTVDKPWHSDMPTGASRKMLTFLREVYNDDEKVQRRKSQTISYGLDIVPKNRTHSALGRGNSSLTKWAAQLKSTEPASRVEAAWHLMTIPEAIPAPIVKTGLADDNPDTRWFLAESLQKNLDADTLALAGQFLWDDDQFVRISAIDAFALAGENALQTLLNAMTDDVGVLMEALKDVIYAIRKVCPESEPETIQSFVASSGNAVAQFLQNSIDSGKPWWHVRGYIRQLRALCKQYDINESVLFSEAIKIIVPRLLKRLSTEEVEYHHISTLREIRRNEAIPLMTMREIADLLGIDSVKIPKNRTTDEERAFLTQVVREALSDMSIEQKARILVILMLHGRKKLRRPAENLLLHIDKAAAVSAITQALAQQSFGVNSIKSIIDVLEQIDPSAMDSLVEWKDDAYVLASGAGENLSREKDIDELVEMLASRSGSMRRSTAYALAQKCDSDADIDKVIAALGHIEPRAREAAVLALGAMSDNPRTWVALRGALNASHFKVRRAALRAYTRRNPPDAIDTLFHIIERWDSWLVKRAAVYELKRYTDDDRVLHKLREIQNDERYHRRIRAAAERVLPKTPGKPPL